MVSTIYTLPEIQFVGGESQKLTFSLYKNLGKSNQTPYDASGCTVNFALISYSNKIGVPLLSKEATVRKGEQEAYSFADVDLDPQDTVSLYGKYIYQLSIKDIDGNIGIPNQGIMFITKNINQGFVFN